MKHRRGNLPVSRSISNNCPGEVKERIRPRPAKQSPSPYFLSRLLAGGVIGLLLGFILFKRHAADDLHLEPDTVLHIVTPRKHYSTTTWDQQQQPPRHHVIKASRTLFSTLSKQNKRTFYAQDGWTCQGMIRALRNLGWTRVAQKKNARLIYTQERHTDWYSKLEPWQRYNHIPEPWHWSHRHKDYYNLESEFREYAKTFNRSLGFLPETFHLDSQREEFRQRLFDRGGLNDSWLLKQPNEGTMLLAADSEELKNVLQMAREDPSIVQQYICNIMTVRMYVMSWEQCKLRKVRMYWFVASMDPLIVLYMDGYVHIGNATHDEKASFAQFGEILRQHHDANDKLQKRIMDPMIHVRNQCKESLSLLIDAFKNKTFQRGTLLSEDAFELYSADYVVDNDLNVWLLETHEDMDMDEDYYFLVDLHHHISNGMVLTLEEIWDKQTKGLPILPLRSTGRWEVIYADGWMFKYEAFERSHNKTSCDLQDSIVS